MDHASLLEMYARLKRRVAHLKTTGIAESQSAFYRDAAVHAVARDLGLLSDTASDAAAVHQLNRAVATIASATGDSEGLIQAVLRQHAGGVGAVASSSRGRAQPAPKRPTIKDLPQDQRPRERLTSGGDEQLTDAELLAIIIGSGTTRHTALDVAHRLLARYGSFRGLSTRTVRELQETPGIGAARAAQIKAALAIARRYASSPLTEGKKVKGSHDLFAHFHEELRHLAKEAFWAVLLDQKHKIIRSVRISEGTLSQSVVHPREAFSPAIRDSAAAVAFVHNHPSGDPEPSPEDVEITRRLKEVGDLVGIRMIDHVIIGSDSYVSLAERGIL